MERMGGKEQLLQQMYSAMATNKDDTVNLVLRSYGTPWAIPLWRGSLSRVLECLRAF